MRPVLLAAHLALAATLAARPAAAASLRAMVVLHAPVVRLSDLFDGAGPAADRVLGPGPAPGARIVVEAPQLAAIAQQFGVDWQPASPADRAVLERRGTLLPRAVVLAALRTALQGVGAPADGQIDLPGFSAPLVPPEADAQANVEQFDYQGASGRFTGVLAVAGKGMDMLRLRVSGTLTAMVELPVAVRRLVAGAVIGPADL
ncbi:MAG: hypothetical protein KGQ40_14915, partial [Rhodospirillales bacterium]|nr:hypothetical protein [Rhodospirillales bacterium]